MQLIEIMSEGSPNEKTAILNKLHTHPVGDDVYVQQIVNAGKADSNYIVRYVALHENIDCVGSSRSHSKFNTCFAYMQILKMSSLHI